MPKAGDEGYERLVICPYDKSHEVRAGRLQFHLDKCRKNYPNAEKIQCPFNSSHIIPKVEEQFHIEVECQARSVWDRHIHELGDVNCPVKDLVPVNAVTVPDGDENWDNYEAQGSVLANIQAKAQEKNIVRYMQCESKAKRKAFRKAERERHSQLEQETSHKPYAPEPAPPKPAPEWGPPPKPTKAPTIPVVRQDPADAVAALNRQFRTLDMNLKDSSLAQPPSESSSMYNAPPSQRSGARSPDSEYGSVSSTSKPGSSVLDPRSPSFQPATECVTSRPPAAVSPALSSTSSWGRPTTAMSIAASVSRLNAIPPDEDGFCQLPIPGRGRGRRTKVVN